jgi:hypothetical protein
MDAVLRGIEKTKNFYQMKKDSPLVMKEFGYYSLDRWAREGYIDKEKKKDPNYLRELFGFDYPGEAYLQCLGWCEAAFCPDFEIKVIEDRGKYEVVQDHAGRYVLYFKGRRDGFMPEYLDHPVKDMESWKRNCEWRMDPLAPEREKLLENNLNHVIKSRDRGMFITQKVIGGYMYLRSLMGPERVLYMFYDDPELIHMCMRKWFELADYVTAYFQKEVTIDQLFLAEDICYNRGLLISPDMIREFLLPYYKQLIENIKKRQIDRSRHLFIQIDTDGFADPAIDVYLEIGMDVMSPFEVAANCDVLRTAEKYPELRITGGMDKRVLATTKDEIDKMVDRICSVMRKRGGYIPTCDHGVPEEVSFENYMHFRKRLLEYSV